jgi:hypothetical protein
MQQTRVRPHAFAQANAVRSLGIGMTGLASVLSGAVLGALVVIIFLAAGLAGGVGPFVPGLLAAVLLGGYLAVAPPVFANRTPASTAATTGGWLAAALGGYAVLWAVLLAAV